MASEGSKFGKARIALERKQALTGAGQQRGRVVGTETMIDLESLGREYKLGQGYRRIRNLEFRSLGDAKLQRFRDYLDIVKDKIKLQLDASPRPRPSFPDDEAYLNANTKLHYPGGTVLILVDAPLYGDVGAAVDQYVLDLAHDGYWATVYVVNGGSPAHVRNFIKSKNPVGVLLVGAIVAPWYDHHGDEFPCDLYYMDTNGTWAVGADGQLEGHDGNLDPEIWVGRLQTPTEGGNDAALINDYFARNHRFRRGGLGHARSALAYVDDDWVGFDDCAFDEMFPSSAITKYNNPLTTDADLYKAEVNSLRSWTQLCAHSWTGGHAFTVGLNHEYIDSAYFRETNPPNSHFYNLFCCGPGRFTSPDYLGGWYIFDRSGGGTNHGLTAVGSGKSGSMLFFEDFYRPMGAGKVIGAAYVDWWRARGPEHEDWERYWFYGLSLLGDPTLTWWKGAVPQPEQPQAGDTFDHWPRNMQLRWDPVNIAGVKYTVEIDAFGAVDAGKWAEESGKTFAMYHGIVTNTLDHVFVGAQRGRWRVRASVAGQSCSWSPWSYFRFTV